MKVAIVIPTYNERQNIRELVSKILKLKIECLNIVVVDDNSPDHTQDIVKEMNRLHKNVILISRKAKKGRGLAGKIGFKKALKIGADYIIEMDADLSHDPRYIPSMLRAIKNHDVVIGSRYVKGGSDTERSFLRKLLSVLSIALVKMVLSTNVKDPNSGFRCFSRKALLSIIDDVNSRGTEIVQEMIYLLHKKGFEIKEIPIKFKERKRGKSTKNIVDIINSLKKIITLRLALTP